MEFIGDDVIELETVRTQREVRFDLTHENQHNPIEDQKYPEPNQTNALQRNHWSSSTQRVLSSMPSRSIRLGQTVSKYQRQTRRRSRASNNAVSSTACNTELDMFLGLEDCASDATQRQGLLQNLQGLSAGECVRVLRDMPLSVTEKRQLRALACGGEAGQPVSANRSRLGSQFPASCLKVLRGGLGQQKSIQLGQGVLKSISAHFGTGVLSYFTFLRTLLHYNILLFLINGLFLFLPQVTNPPHSGTKKTANLIDLWPLTGMGILTDSGMYYGYYANSTGGKCITEICSKNYNIPLAYIFTIGIGLFVTCVMLVYSMSKSFGRSVHIYRSNGNVALKVFCSWDFKINKKRSVKLQSVNICTQLKEIVSELSCSRQKRNMKSMLSWLAEHFLIWFICLLSIAVCVMPVYFRDYFEQKLFPNADDPLRLLLLPMFVSCVSHLLPVFFNMLSRSESYDSPSVHIYFSIARNLLLKGCIIAVMCCYWLREIATKQEENQLQCWETFVGQELYRLVLMDLIISVLSIIFGEFLWGLCIQSLSLRRRKLVFNITRNVLELIYGQTLVWFGVLFAPLLPAVQTGKLFLLFYFKKKCLIMNFQAPKNHLRTAQMNTVLITLLFFPSFVGALACVIYTMWRIGPSSECGPFRNLHNMSLSDWITDLVRSYPSMTWLSWVYTNLLDNALFLFIFVGLILTIIYIHTQVLDGQKKVISMLQKQIDFEGEDKKFLIAKLQALNEQSDDVL